MQLDAEEDDQPFFQPPPIQTEPLLSPELGSDRPRQSSEGVEDVHGAAAAVADAVAEEEQ